MAPCSALLIPRGCCATGCAGRAAEGPHAARADADVRAEPARGGQDHAAAADDEWVRLVQTATLYHSSAVLPCAAHDAGALVSQRTAQLFAASLQLKIFKSPGAHIYVCRYVYDGVLEAQFIMVHDVNKQLLGVADIYPGNHCARCRPSSWRAAP
jgi:hypothetical protein